MVSLIHSPFSRPCLKVEGIMKNSILSLLLLVSTVTVVQANLSDLSERIVQQSRQLQRSVDDYQFGHNGRRDSRAVRRDAQELQNLVGFMLREIDNGDVRPPGPPPGPAPMPI